VGEGRRELSENLSIFSSEDPDQHTVSPPLVSGVANERTSFGSLVTWFACCCCCVVGVGVIRQQQTLVSLEKKRPTWREQATEDYRMREIS